MLSPHTAWGFVSGRRESAVSGGGCLYSSCADQVRRFEADDARQVPHRWLKRLARLRNRTAAQKTPALFAAAFLETDLPLKGVIRRISAGFFKSSDDPKLRDSPRCLPYGENRLCTRQVQFRPDLHRNEGRHADPRRRTLLNLQNNCTEELVLRRVPYPCFTSLPAAMRAQTLRNALRASVSTRGEDRCR